MLCRCWSESWSGKCLPCAPACRIRGRSTHRSEVTLALVVLVAAAPSAWFLRRTRTRHGLPIHLAPPLSTVPVAEVRVAALATLLSSVHVCHHCLLSYLLQSPLIFHRLIRGVVLSQGLLCGTNVFRREEDAGFEAGEDCPSSLSLLPVVPMPGGLGTKRNLYLDVSNGRRLGFQS